MIVKDTQPKLKTLSENSKYFAYTVTPLSVSLFTPNHLFSNVPLSVYHHAKVNPVLFGCCIFISGT
jgi:hypothetical protein